METVTGSPGPGSAADPDPLERLGRQWDIRLRDAKTWWDSNRDAREKYIKIYKEGRPGSGATTNLIYPWVWIVSGLLYAELPQIQVDVREYSSGNPVLAEALERWLQYSYQCQETQDGNDVAVFDALLRGIAWTKESYDPVSGMDISDPLGPLEVFCDPLARFRLSEARWILQVVVQPIEEARRFLGMNELEPNYSLADRKGLENAGYDQSSVAREKDLFRYYECWWKDGDNRWLGYRDDERRRWLGEIRPWPVTLPDGDFPFSPLVFNTQYLRIDGFSEQSVVDSLQEQYQKLVEYEAKHTLRAIAKKILLAEGVFDENTKEKILSGKDLEALEVKKPPGERLEDVAAVLDFNKGEGIGEENYQRAKILHDETLGMDELQRGAMTRKLTATQSEIIDEFSKLRIGRRQKIVDRWLTRQVRHRAALALRLVDFSRVAAVAGPEAAMAWAQYAGGDAGEAYRVGIEAGSTGERRKRIRVQEAQDNLGLFATVNQSAGQPVFDVVEAAMAILRARDVRNPERYLVRQEPPPLPGPAGLSGLVPAGPGLPPMEPALPAGPPAGLAGLAGAG